MTEEFKEKALIVLKESNPLLTEGDLLKIAQIIWDLMPVIYGKEAS